MGLLYGFDIGGTKIEFSVFSEDLEKKETSRISTPVSDYDEFISAIVSFVEQADNKYQQEGEVGIGLPGQQTKENITRCNNIPSINGKTLKSDLEKVLGRTVNIANDANCFALSEARSRKLSDVSSVLALIFGTGFGGGFVVNKQLYSGFNGAALELGHMPLPEEARAKLSKRVTSVQCRCGKTDCMDHYLSGTGFTRLYNEMLNENLTGPEIVERYQKIHTPTLKFVNEYLDMVAFALSGIINILDPEVIVLGGGLSNFDAIYDKLPSLLQKYSLQQRPSPRLYKAAYGDSSGIRGAALLNQ